MSDNIKQQIRQLQHELDRECLAYEARVNQIKLQIVLLQSDCTHDDVNNCYCMTCDKFIEGVDNE